MQQRRSGISRRMEITEWMSQSVYRMLLSYALNTSSCEALDISTVSHTGVNFSNSGG